MGQDMTPFILKSPMTHTTSAKDIVLTGRNFQTPDFRTKQAGDMVMTGAFVPFGTETRPGQVIKGTNKAGGAILVFDPTNAEATLKSYAWGFRNVIGFAWNKRGEMYATQNGYDVVASRPVNDQYDPTYRVRKDAWYGWPDFSAALEPVTNAKFKAPGEIMAPVYINGEKQEKSWVSSLTTKPVGLLPPTNHSYLDCTRLIPPLPSRILHLIPGGTWPASCLCPNGEIWPGLPILCGITRLATGSCELIRPVAESSLSFITPCPDQLRNKGRWAWASSGPSM